MFCCLMSTLVCGSYYIFNIPISNISNHNHGHDTTQSVEAVVYFESPRDIIFGSIRDKMLPICYSQMPLFIESGTHHKTGHHFATTLVNKILQFCGIDEHFASTFHSKHYYFARQKGWPLKFINTHYFDKYFVDNPIILLHFIRSPLNTIISGFNYHIQCPESWTQCNLNNKFCEFSQSKWINVNPNRDSNIDSDLLNIKPTTDKSNSSGHIDDKLDQLKTHAYASMSNQRILLHSGYLHNQYNQRLQQGKKDDDIDDSETSSSSSLPRYSPYGNSKKMKKYKYTSKNLIWHVDDCLTRKKMYRMGDGIKNVARLKLIKQSVLDDVINRDESLCQFYSRVSKQSQIEALYYEMVRYINCEFDSIYETSKLIANYQFGYTFWMDDYTQSAYNYDIFVNQLVTNVLNLTFDDYTIMIDKKNEHIFVNDSLFEYKFTHGHNNKFKRKNDFTKLMQKLLPLDLNRWDDRKIVQSSHITRNKNESTLSIAKNKAIDGLLKFKYVTDGNVIIDACQLIKQMTIMVGRSWQYDKYC